MIRKGDVVSVFGSARIKADHPVYADSLALGEQLARQGLSVMTGGYGGVMEAVSKGAMNARGHVIGVTVNLFEKTGRRAGHNGYIDEVISFDLLSARLLYLINNCDAAIACGGGVGTMSEISLIWSLIDTGELEPRPLILIGEMWPPIFRLLADHGTYISDRSMNVVRFAADASEAIRYLEEWE